MHLFWLKDNNQTLKYISYSLINAKKLYHYYSFELIGQLVSKISKQRLRCSVKEKQIISLIISNRIIIEIGMKTKLFINK